MNERPAAGERAVVVQLDFGASDVAEQLEEVRLLTESAGATVCAVVHGRRQSPDAATYAGKGKVQEVAAEVAAHQANLVVFNHELSPAQERNLERVLQCRVIDRTSLILDIFAQRAQSSEGKLQVARAVDQACRDIGFLVITNHQIPTELVERVSRLTRQFFALPLAEKRKVDRPSPDMVRGYSAVAEESLSYSLEEAAPGDLKESFSIGPSDVPDEPYYRCAAAGPHFAPNVWPSGISGFEQAYREYFAAMSTLAQSLMRIFALALDLPETFFDDKIDKHISMFRSLS